MSDWIGPLSLLVTLTGVVTTIVAALTAAWIGKQYVSHLEEIAAAKKRYEQTIRAFEDNEQRQAGRLTISIAGMESLFGLLMIERRKERLHAHLRALETDNKWAGKDVAGERKRNVLDAIREEIKRVVAESSARQYELYILLLGGANRSAYIRDLVETYGDARSLRILEVIHDCQDGLWDQEEIRAAIYELRRRLRSA